MAGLLGIDLAQFDADPVPFELVSDDSDGSRPDERIKHHSSACWCLTAACGTQLSWPLVVGRWRALPGSLTCRADFLGTARQDRSGDQGFGESSMVTSRGWCGCDCPDITGVLPERVGSDPGLFHLVQTRVVAGQQSRPVGPWFRRWSIRRWPTLGSFGWDADGVKIEVIVTGADQQVDRFPSAGQSILD